MISAREQVLTRIRSALEPTYAICEARLRMHPRNLIPKQGNVPSAQLSRNFLKTARAAGATAEEVFDLDQVLPSIIRYLAQNQQPARVCMAEIPELKELARKYNSVLAITHGTCTEQDPTAVTTAVVGIAETGTIMVASSTGHSSRFNFLPSNHIAVLGSDQIVANPEAAWDILRARCREQDRLLPRHISFITGPSRTADIEQKLQIGVHGPRHLHLIVVASGMGMLGVEWR